MPTPTESDKTTREPVALVATDDLKDPAVRAAFAAKMADAIVDAVNHDRVTAGLPPLQDDPEDAEPALALPANPNEGAIPMNAKNPTPDDGYDAALALASAQYTVGASADDDEDHRPAAPRVPDWDMDEVTIARYRAMLGLDDPDPR
jgi:hypothetical protein